MVKFVGGPSVSAQKSYYNHRIARPGQFRIPRAYGSVKKETKIVVRNYNYCGNSYGNYGGWQLPSWLQWLQLGANWLQNLLPQPKTPEPPTPEPEIKKKKDPEPVEENPEPEPEPEVEKPEKPEEPEKPKETQANVTLSAESKKTPDKVEEQTVKVFNKTTRKDAHHNEGYTWQSLQNAYVAEDGSTVPNTTAFRNWFRETYLNGATDIGINEQHYPKTITYGGKTYNFDKEKYKPQLIKLDNGYNGTSAHTEAKTKTIEGTTVWRGVAIATWTDENGKEQQKTVTVNNQTSKDNTLTELKRLIKEQVPENAKIKYGTKEQ